MDASVHILTGVCTLVNEYSTFVLFYNSSQLKYVGSPYRWTEMYAGRVACPPADKSQ